MTRIKRFSVVCSVLTCWTHQYNYILTTKKCILECRSLHLNAEHSQPLCIGLFRGRGFIPTSRLDIYLSHLSRENVRLMTSPEGDTWLIPRRKHNSGDSVRWFSVYFNFIPFDFLLLFPGRQQTRPALSVFSPLESLPPPLRLSSAKH